MDRLQYTTAQCRHHQSLLTAPNLVAPYMQPLRTFCRDHHESSALVHGKIIDERKINFYYTYRTEEWNPSLPNDFFSHWIQDTENNDGKRDGPKTFASNLSWMRENAGTIKTNPDFRMYIAYATDPTGVVVMATCVFVQPGSVFTMSGSTHENVHLTQYVAGVVSNIIDPRTKGLLFRPCQTIRRLFLKKWGHAVDGESCKGDTIGGFVGSESRTTEQDKALFHKRYSSTGNIDTVSDDDPSIIIYLTTHRVTFRRFVIDNEGKYLCRGWHVPIKFPFWEPPSATANPYSVNNPQIPLVFFPIQTLCS